MTNQNKMTKATMITLICTVIGTATAVIGVYLNMTSKEPVSTQNREVGKGPGNSITAPQSPGNANDPGEYDIQLQMEKKLKENISGKWSITNSEGTFLILIEQVGTAITSKEYDQYNQLVGQGNGTYVNGTVAVTMKENLGDGLEYYKVFLEISQNGKQLLGKITGEGYIQQVILDRQP